MEPTKPASCDIVALYNLIVDTGRQKLILDVRSTDEYFVGCIRASLNYPAVGFQPGVVPATGKKLMSTGSAELRPDWVEKEDKSLSLRGILYQTCVVYDADGATDGEAARVATILQNEAKIKNVFYLAGMTFSPRWLGRRYAHTLRRWI